jgi:hypothetical protein
MALRTIAVLCLLLIPLLVGSVAAQESVTTPNTQTGSAEQPQACEVIDSQTSLCNAELEDGSAVLTIRSEENQRITFTDAGAFVAGGVVETQTRTITDGRSEIVFPVTQHNGFAGVSISTDDVLYAVPLESQSSMLKPPITASDVQAGAVGGAASVSIFVLFITWRAVTGRDDSPERVA